MADIRTLDPHFLPNAKAFLSALDQNGVTYSVTSARRSYAEQARLSRLASAGLSGGLPAAPPGYSLHEWGLAFDLGTNPPSVLTVIGPIWQKFGLGIWGGFFRRPKYDPVHFEASPKVKALAGWRKGVPYEPGLIDEGIGPIGILTPTKGPLGVLNLITGPVEDWLGRLFR